MAYFLIGMAILIVGYFTYGKLAEKIVGPDDRETPALRKRDGVDFVPLPHWKNMLIQLLNIAGVGPVIGVILGVKFGSIVFLIIPVGNIIGGAVHDFVAGMMSIRNHGANLPALIRMTLGNGVFRAFSVFMVFLLLLVVAVFINIPAGLIDGLFPAHDIFWLAVPLIFLYYIGATLFPVDKIIGRLYPLFGGLLLVGTLAIFVTLMWKVGTNPELLSESEAFREKMFTSPNAPIIPMLFVTIACGILSGFHATQSPIIARTMRSERQGRPAFYGMMALEGLIAMVWAAAGLAIYNLFPEFMDLPPTRVLGEITSYFLGTGVGLITILSVVILAVTSGDTAMRSLRLSLAEILRIDQKPYIKRLLVCIPLIVTVALLLAWSNRNAATFAVLWNYFAWGNQVLGAATLTSATVWLIAWKRPGWLTLVPAMFMSFIVLTYILWISPGRGEGAASAVGFGLPLHAAYLIAGAIVVVLAFLTVQRGRKLQNTPPELQE